MAIINGKSTLTDEERKKTGVNTKIPVNTAPNVIQKEDTNVFDTERALRTMRTGGLSAPAGSPKTPMEAKTLKESTDLINAQQEPQITQETEVPTVGTETVEAPTVEAPKPITALEDEQSILTDLESKVEGIRSESISLTAQNREISALNQQAQASVAKIRQEEKLRKSEQVKLGDEFTAELLEERIGGIKELQATMLAKGEDISLKAAANQWDAMQKFDKVTPFVEQSKILDEMLASPTFDTKTTFEVGASQFSGNTQETEKYMKSRGFLDSDIAKQKKEWQKAKNWDDATIKTDDFRQVISNLYTGEDQNILSLSQFVKDSKTAGLSDDFIAGQLNAISNSLSANSDVRDEAKALVGEITETKADQFDIKTDRFGNLVRINKVTGEKLSIEGEGVGEINLSLGEPDKKRWENVVAQQHIDGEITAGDIEKLHGKAGAEAIGREEARILGSEDYTKREQEKGEQIGAINDILDDIAIDISDDAPSTSGFKSVVGFGFQKYLANLPFTEKTFIEGTDAFNFDKKIEQLKNALAVPSLEKMKGAMSDKDIIFIKNIATKLDAGMTEKAFIKEIKNLQSRMKKISETYQIKLQDFSTLEPTKELLQTDITEQVEGGNVNIHNKLQGEDFTNHGNFQMNRSVASSFAKSLGMTNTDPESEEFKTEWDTKVQELGETGFKEKEREHIVTTMYKPQVQKLRALKIPEVVLNNEKMQKAIFDAVVQHGGSTKRIQQGIRSAMEKFGSPTIDQIIQEIGVKRTLDTQAIAPTLRKGATGRVKNVTAQLTNNA